MANIECNDGFIMSVVAGNGINYSWPRKGPGPFAEVEVGYPSRFEPLIVPYQDGPGEPTMSVYAYVPTNVLIKVIQKHGGLKSGTLPPLVHQE